MEEEDIGTSRNPDKGCFRAEGKERARIKELEEQVQNLEKEVTRLQ